MNTACKRQRGNAFFLVLIAVVLFAALSFAVTQSTRNNGGQKVEEEKADMLVSRVEQLVAHIRAEILRLNIRGCPLEDISFYSSLWAFPAFTDNVNTPFAGGDFSCHLFHPDGAGMTWFGEDLNEVCEQFGVFCGGSVFIFTGDMAVEGIGSANAELSMHADRINQEFCEALNRKIGLSSVPLDTPNIGLGSFFTGAFDDSSPQILGDVATELYGIDMGCYDRGGVTKNFYAVLVER